MNIYDIIIYNPNNSHIGSFTLNDVVTFSEPIQINALNSLNIYFDYTNNGRSTLYIPTIDSYNNTAMFSMEFKKTGNNNYRLTPRNNMALIRAII